MSVGVHGETKQKGLVLTSNQSIADLFKLQEINDVIHVCNLFLLRDSGRLTEEGGKDQRLFDCCCALVHILLLTVSGRPLETDTLRPTINEDGSMDFSRIFSLSKYIQ